LDQEKAIRRSSAGGSSETLKKYLQEISRLPRITADEEKVLGDRIQRGDRAALRKLVEANLRFVVSFAKRYRNCGLSFLDLINEGNIGLIEAAKRFNPKKNVKFITYAVWWVRQAISNALSEQWGAIRLPHKQATLHSRLGRVKEALSRSLGREATMEEIATEAGLRPDEAENLMAMSRSSESLSELFGAEEDRTLGDTLEQTSVAAADDQLLQRSSVEQTRNLLESLPKKERAILCRRFGIPEDGSDGEREPMTLQEIGEELRLSRERVRQIEAQAIARIKRTMKSRALKAFLN
jgi:RNA polymerase primary sigma factor